MTNLRESIRNFFSSTPEALPAGMFHYQSPPDDPRNYRLHLRMEPDGTGILMINASTVLHLNQTAAEYAYYLVQNLPTSEAAKKVATRYKVNEQQAAEDYQDLVEKIQILINTPDLDPITFLDFERQTPFTGRISAPYRLDCALTYSQPESVSPEVAPSDRVERELTTAEWQTILDKAWAAGIPHVIFTGGEPTLRPDLPELIARAEANSQVTGLLTDGLRLADSDYLNQLLQTGLDHLMIVFQPENELAWAALKNALAADIFVAVHLTINEKNRDEVKDLLARLVREGVGAISLSAAQPALAPDLQAARDEVAQLQLELVWNLPVPYSAFHPVALETGRLDSPVGAGKAFLYVEPDGDVLPAQGVNQRLGNILSDPWEKIWKSAS